jgi:hypothetical protein
MMQQLIYKELLTYMDVRLHAAQCTALNIVNTSFLSLLPYAAYVSERSQED